MTEPRPYLVGLIGAGVTPSLTPPMHMAEAAHLGLSYVYRRIDLSALDLSPDRLGDILDWAERLGFDAVNVTHPCKQTVLPLLQRVDPVAAALGAVNTVLFTPEGRVGYNTDTTGFARAFAHGLPDAATDRVVQLGAGGAGSAVADALLRLGTHTLFLADVDPVRAETLAADLCARHGAGRAEFLHPGALARVLGDADGLVHCTPTGMAEHPGTPLDVSLLHSGLWVADIVYRPLDTELLIAARRAGCRTLHGGAMAVFQAVDAFELITDHRPDADRMAAHFTRLVTAPAVLTR